MRAAFLIVVAVMGSAVAAMEQPTAGNATNGNRLFERDGCFQCHGYAGQGGRDGARIAATAMSAAAFTRYIRRPIGAMPAFTAKVLSDADAADLYAYLQSMPRAKAARDIPLLNQLRR